MEKRYITFFALILSLYASAQGVWMHPNKGQWNEKINYKVELQQGEMFLDKTGFTYFLHDAAQRHSHSTTTHDQHSDDSIIHTQIIRTTFLNATWNNERLEEASSSWYRNYYTDKDPSKWKAGVRSFKVVTFKNVYAGIDAVFDGNSDKLKYSFVVQAHKNPQQIQYTIKGATKVYLDKSGKLHTVNRFGEIVESAPVAWTEKDGQRKAVKVAYKIKNNIVSFALPNGYDASATLTIDPYLVFSSFTGSTADNWGMTATPDVQGNLYAGGIVFTSGGSYPTVTGSFDLSINGGQSYNWQGGTLPGFDVAISKFNTSGTSLVFSTYLGGNSNEAPHSLFVDANNDLYVFGVTSSPNFPTSTGCFDNTLNGGPTISENELGYFGADLFVCHFNAAGSALVGSTYVGGTETDGVNIGILNYNYGDSFRGEIIVRNGFVYVSSTTRSSNFPTVGASQNTLNGSQDAVVFKMNTALTSMAWSTYFGGSGLESGNSLQLSSNGDLFMTGGTSSSNLAFTSGNDLSFNGGNSDGYLVKLNSTNAAVLSGTYMGMSEYDQAFFVQLDINNEVYVYGQTESSWPISPGTYGNPNSGQFIRKYNNNLQTILWTTMIGASTGHPEISPTAFLVSDCFDIYISGWGGTINSSFSTQATFSTTNGFPTTSDGYQLNTNGSNFYLAVLSQNAATLKYATYMGGTASSFNHVDGGTSRFDKTGRIYHAVCGACGGNNNGFTTTPGVWSPTNQSSNCNLAAFKFDLNTVEVVATAPSTLICIPNSAVFSSNSVNGNTYAWDFGDGTTASQPNVSHAYTTSGNFNVTLIVSDSIGCYVSDTVTFQVQIGTFQGGIVPPPSPICPGESFQLQANGGSSYLWSPANLLNSATVANPIATVQQTTTFNVIITDICGVDTLQAVLQVYPVNTSLSNDTSFCLGDSVQLVASGGSSYLWQPAAVLSNNTIANPFASPITTTTFSVQITTPNSCVVNDSVTVVVNEGLPQPVIADTAKMCYGTSVALSVSGGNSYSWSPFNYLSSDVGSTVTAFPPSDRYYYCDFINSCGTTQDSVFVDVVQATVLAGNDTLICYGDTVSLWASGAINYLWTPSDYLYPSNASNVFAHPLLTTVYSVIGSDETGCLDTAKVTVSVRPQIYVTACSDVYASVGDLVQLSATSTTNGTYSWSVSDFLSCITCNNPIASPNKDFTYTVTLTDENGCKARDKVSIFYETLVHIPNTFTPNGDDINYFFKPVISDRVSTFEFLIFNRWGELICILDSAEKSWDGTYKGKACEIGTYTWKLQFADIRNEFYVLEGHVNLVR